MKALRVEAAGRSAVCEMDRQPLGPDDVRLKVHYVGLCGSDLNTFRGLNPLVTFPRVPGHEVSATVLEKGAAVGDTIALGQPVIVWPYSACGSCESCRKGRTNACRHNQTLGVQRDGALREDIVVPVGAVIPNDVIPARRLVLVEPLSVGFHTVRRGNVAADDTVLVLGCGMIGLGAIMAAARRGARVLAVDPIAGKEDIARRCGADSYSTLTGEALADEIGALTDGHGADVVIEAVGSPKTFLAAVDLAGYCGRIVYVGYSKEPVTYDTKFFNLKELDIFGSRNATRADFADVIAALEDFGDQADMLITRQFSLDEAADALPFWDRNPEDVLKLVVSL